MISMREVRICIQYYDSPCGRLVLASFADRLCLCDWSDNPFAERNMRRLTRNMKTSFKTETTSVLEETKRQLDEYFAGKRKAFDIQLRLAGTDFQHEVWNALLDIPYGATKSYKDISPMHRQAQSRESRSRSHRRKQHQHPNPLPPRNRQRPFTDRLCGRIGG